MTPPDLHPMLQPDQTGMCGQTCVAMIAGCTLPEAALACGTSVLNNEGSSTASLVRGLRRLGVKVGKPYTYKGRKRRVVDWPSFALMSVANNKTNWAHAVVLKDGWVYDPGIGWPLPAHVYEMVIVEMAYSRRFRAKHLKKRAVKAYWSEVIPIVAVPKEAKPS